MYLSNAVSRLSLDTGFTEENFWAPKPVYRYQKPMALISYDLCIPLIFEFYLISIFVNK